MTAEPPARTTRGLLLRRVAQVVNVVAAVAVWCVGMAVVMSAWGHLMVTSMWGAGWHFEDCWFYACEGPPLPPWSVLDWLRYLAGFSGWIVVGTLLTWVAYVTGRLHLRRDWLRSRVTAVRVAGAAASLQVALATMGGAANVTAAWHDWRVKIRHERLSMYPLDEAGLGASLWLFWILAVALLVAAAWWLYVLVRVDDD